jgi:heme/copper-type cytochrome/quinol oxidase subunit 3
MSEHNERQRGHAQPARPEPPEPHAPMHPGAGLDVASLPTFGFGQRSPMWWATLGLIAIESTVFALTIMSYFYLRSHANVWPMTGMPPDLLWGTLNTAILLVSMVPNQLAKKAAERMELGPVRLWMVVCLLFSIAFLVVRGLEFTALHTRWDSDAYGSIVWMLLGLHTTHLVTDTYDSAVLTVLMFTGPLESKRFVDVSENAVYWYFVVLSWIPIYAVIYFGARY